MKRLMVASILAPLTCVTLNVATQTEAWASRFTWRGTSDYFSDVVVEGEIDESTGYFNDLVLWISDKYVAGLQPSGGGEFYYQPYQPPVVAVGPLGLVKFSELPSEPPSLDLKGGTLVSFDLDVLHQPRPWIKDLTRGERGLVPSVVAVGLAAEVADLGLNWFFAFDGTYLVKSDEDERILVNGWGFINYGLDPSSYDAWVGGGSFEADLAVLGGIGDESSSEVVDVVEPGSLYALLVIGGVGYLKRRRSLASSEAS